MKSIIHLSVAASLMALVAVSLSGMLTIGIILSPVILY